MHLRNINLHALAFTLIAVLGCDDRLADAPVPDALGTGSESGSPAPGGEGCETSTGDGDGDGDGDIAPVIICDAGDSVYRKNDVWCDAGDPLLCVAGVFLEDAASSACCPFGDDVNCGLVAFGDPCPVTKPEHVCDSGAPAPADESPNLVCGDAEGIYVYQEESPLCDAGYEHLCTVGTFAPEPEAAVFAVCCDPLGDYDDCLLRFDGVCLDGEEHLCDKFW